MEPTHRSPFAVAVAIAGVVAFLAFGLTVFLEVIGWLKHGYWEPIDVTDAFRSIGLAEPYFEEWVGAQKVWNILRQAPLSLVCLGIGLGLLTIARYLYWPTDRGGRMQR